MKSGAANRKQAARGGRIEDMLGRQHPRDSAQHRPRLLDQIERERGRLHPDPGLDQQGIAELLAQPGQGMADCRLRASQPLRRPGDAAFDHQDIENNQQIEIKPTEIDFIHDVA
jgi:hypothetical protein